MLIAHIPAGYLITRAVIKKLPLDVGIELKYLWVLGGAIVPDLDLLYFYLFDSSGHHHKYLLTYRYFGSVYFFCYL